MDVKEQIFASLHAHLQLGQVNSERRAVFENGLADPIVRALVFTNPHVSESSTESIQLSERHAGKRGVGLVGCRGFAGLDGLGRIDTDGAFEGQCLLFSGLQTTNSPRDGAVVKFGTSSHLKLHGRSQGASDDNVVQFNAREILHLEFKRERSRVFTDGNGQRALLRA